MLFLVLVLRFPLENPSENLPKLARSAGAGRSQCQLGQLGAGASWARGQLAWPGRVGAASQQACKQLSRSQGKRGSGSPGPEPVFQDLGLLHQAHKRKKLKEKTLQRVSGRSGQLRAECATCFGFRSLSDQDVRTWC